MKIFSSSKIKVIDSYTIENEPIKSIDLMERAAHKLLEWLVSHFGRPRHFVIFTGPGNNGGDGLALARLLQENRYDVDIQHINITDKVSDDWRINFKRLEKLNGVQFNNLTSAEQFPLICANDIIIDAIFGSGLTRPVDGLAGDVIKKINGSGNIVISVDIPSGLFVEDNSHNTPENIIKADYTLSFQFPKLSFLFAENYCYSGEWHLLPIGLHPAGIRDTMTQFYFIDEKEVNPLLKERNKFDHKGKFGHGLLIAGSKGKIGAAVLSAKAALKTGIGLITCHVPADARNVIHSSVAEAMVSADENDNLITSLPDLTPYTSIGIGPGIGSEKTTQNILHKVLLDCKKPIVIDADAINILGINKKWLSSLPAGSILTPHPKEFERIAGKTANSFKRLLTQISFSERYKCVIVLKGAFTSVSLPDGRVFFNSTGNPGMASGGSGDVLTGMILSLLAQGYSPENAAITSVFLHGLAGDMAAKKSCYESIIASDIIENIAGAYNLTRNITYEMKDKR
jgi:ADP-dependent NAD(P)H-hydrate dehydratase / NAD(P)H-hydrate epimerase